MKYQHLHPPRTSFCSTSNEISTSPYSQSLVLLHVQLKYQYLYGPGASFCSTSNEISPFSSSQGPKNATGELCQKAPRAQNLCRAYRKCVSHHTANRSWVAGRVPGLFRRLPRVVYGTRCCTTSNEILRFSSSQGLVLAHVQRNINISILPELLFALRPTKYHYFHPPRALFCSMSIKISTFPSSQDCSQTGKRAPLRCADCRTLARACMMSCTGPRSGHSRDRGVDIVLVLRLMKY